MRRTLAWALAAAILAALAATGLALALLPSSEQPVDSATDVRIATPAPSPAPTPSATPSDAPARERVGTSSGRLEDLNATEELAPVALDLETIGVTRAPVDPVGVEDDGGMEIPTDISRVGWYEYGPEPGAAEGTAVLTAHIDDRTQGRGVFYDLDQLREGDGVDVVMSDDSVRRFTVDEIRQIPKVDLPTGDLFRRDGRARVALITCGGEFDAASRHYRDNIVVLASPAG